jgi:3-hydroxyisobutyrate dehydrogenase
MHNTKIGFIGLGNVGGKLAGSLARHGVELMVRDLNAALEARFVKKGASRAHFPARNGREGRTSSSPACPRLRPARM